MQHLETMLRKELRELEIIVKRAKERIRTAPGGGLQIKKKGDTIEYYYREVGANLSNGRYLKKSERGIVKRIVQRDYDMKIVRCAEERITAINTFLDKYEKTNLNNIYSSTNILRRDLVDSPLLPDDEFIKRWQETEYTGKRFDEDAAEIFTDRGERVRSKSEKIIADKLYSLGIPYRYEYPLVLSGNIKLYPDFTILKMPEREEVYLEHFGMLDNENYAETVMYKLGTYEKNGIFLGKNLFMTYETSKNPLNTRILDSFLKELFREV